MRNIQIISINHQTHDSDERVLLNLTEEGWKQLFSFLKFNLGVQGYVHLMTCNRVELFYESEDDHNERIVEKWLSLVEGTSRVSDSQFQLFSGHEECIDHLLQLSVGFKSAIYGDDQILSQLKKAFETARESRLLSTLLERAYQTTMRFHKQICKETDFKSHTVSLAYQALKSIRNKFGSAGLKNKNVLIIGSGDMAAQVVKYCSKFSFGSVSISNRTESKARKLVGKSYIQVIPYSKLEANQYEIIISCTDQGFEVINDWANIDYFIDLSLYSFQHKHIPVAHILLQQLQELINRQNSARMESVEQVNQILTDKSKEYSLFYNKWKQREKSKRLEVQI